MEIEITTLTIKMEILPEFSSVISSILYHVYFFPPSNPLRTLPPNFSLLPPLPLPPPILPGSHPVALPIVLDKMAVFWSPGRHLITQGAPR